MCVQQYSEIDKNVGRDIGIEKMKKKEMLAIAAAMEKANNALLGGEHKNWQGLSEMLVQCQDAAMQIGTSLEIMGEQYAVVVHLLEDYCENIYQISISLTDEKICRKLAKKVQKQLTDLQNRIQYEVQDDRKQAVFLPYKLSMWDSLESVWRAADADPEYDTFVIPIPYYDKNADGTFGEMHYEGNDFPEDVPVTGYKDYDFEANRPDVVFIHNPFDECNRVTSVHPSFYTKILKKYTDRLVYIPYFILGEDMFENMCVSPGTLFSDVVIAHSASAKEDYVKHLKKLYMENAIMREDEAEKMLQGKILPLGSPKIDKVVNGRKEDYKLPEEWKKILAGKKAVLYNTGVSGILHGNEQELKKIKDTIAFFADRDDVALWWRPHPLSVGTMQSMRPALVEEYQKIVEEYRTSGIGIFDDTADLHRALLWTDMYYGDDSSLIYLYGVQGKPILRQKIDYLMEDYAGDKADESISYRISCPMAGSVYFCAWNHNALYRLDISESKVNTLGGASQELQLEVSLYSNIICQDRTLWLVPSRAHALAEYHLDTGRWTFYELPDRIKSSAVIENKIYMLSSDYRYLWSMDLEEKKLEREEIIYKWKEKIPLSDEYYNDDLYFVDHKIYFLITHTNMLVAYDPKSRQAGIIFVGTTENQYQRLKYDGRCFWLLPNSEKCSVVCWDGKSVKESDTNNYPKDFSWMYGFWHALLRDEKVWLFPYKGNMVLRMDKKSMEIDIALKLNEILDIDNPRIDNVQELPGGRVVIAVSRTGVDSRIVVLDSDSRVLDQYPCVCQNDIPIAFDRIFERLETENYTSSYAYQISEGTEYLLSRACDALVNTGCVFREEQNCFRSLYENSDGTAGARIWEEVKV